MKNLISFGLFFLGITAVYGQFGWSFGGGSSLPFGLGKSDASSSGSASVSTNGGGSVQGSGSASANNQGSLPNFGNLPGVPNLNNLPGLPNTNNLPGVPNHNNLPGVPNLNNLPGVPDLSKLPGLPNTNNLPGVPNLNNLPGIPDLSNLPGLPNTNNLPGLPNLNNLPGIPDLSKLPGLPNLNNLPRLPNLGNLPGIPDLNNLPGVPNLSDLSNFRNLPGISQFNIPQMPSSLPDILKTFGIPTMDDIVQLVRGMRAPNMPSVGEVFDALQNPNAASPDISAALDRINIEEAQNGLNFVEKSLGHAASIVQDRVGNAVQQMQAVAQHVQNNVENAVKSATAPLQSAINAAPQAVQKCVTRNGSPVDSVVGAARDTVTHCVMEEVNEARRRGESVMNKLGSAAANVGEIRDALGGCSINANASLTQLPNVSGPQANCFAAALLKVQVDTLMLPISLAQDAASAMNQVSQLKNVAIQCQADVVAAVSRASLTSSITLAKCTVNPNQ